MGVAPLNIFEHIDKNIVYLAFCIFEKIFIVRAAESSNSNGFLTVFPRYLHTIC